MAASGPSPAAPEVPGVPLGLTGDALRPLRPPTVFSMETKTSGKWRVLPETSRKGVLVPFYIHRTGLGYVLSWNLYFSAFSAFSAGSKMTILEHCSNVAIKNHCRGSRGWPQRTRGIARESQGHPKCLRGRGGRPTRRQRGPRRPLPKIPIIFSVYKH